MRSSVSALSSEIIDIDWRACSPVSAVSFLTGWFCPVNEQITNFCMSPVCITCLWNHNQIQNQANWWKHTKSVTSCKSQDHGVFKFSVHPHSHCVRWNLYTMQTRNEDISFLQPKHKCCKHTVVAIVLAPVKNQQITGRNKLILMTLLLTFRHTAQ